MWFPDYAAWKIDIIRKVNGHCALKYARSARSKDHLFVSFDSHWQQWKQLGVHAAIAKMCFSASYFLLQGKQLPSLSAILRCCNLV